jgi:hypothetical protein
MHWSIYLGILVKINSEVCKQHVTFLLGITTLDHKKKMQSSGEKSIKHRV